jgi:transposase-like protein
MVRRADSTEAIGNALVAKSRGAGYRSIAARFGRPESTVRRWLRAAREPHAQWLYRRGVNHAVLVDRELLVRPTPQQSTLGHALNLLAGAAVRFRDCFGRSDPVWSLIGFFAHGRLLAATRPLHIEGGLPGGSAERMFTWRLQEDHSRRSTGLRPLIG